MCGLSGSPACQECLVHQSCPVHGQLSTARPLCSRLCPLAEDAAPLAGAEATACRWAARSAMEAVTSSVSSTKVWRFSTLDCRHASRAERGPAWSVGVSTRGAKPKAARGRCFFLLVGRRCRAGCGPFRQAPPNPTAQRKERSGGGSSLHQDLAHLLVHGAAVGDGGQAHPEARLMSQRPCPRATCGAPSQAVHPNVRWECFRPAMGVARGGARVAACAVPSLETRLH